MMWTHFFQEVTKKIQENKVVDTADDDWFEIISILKLKRGMMHCTFF